MTAGSLVAGAGLVLLSRIDAETSYVSGILPGLLVFGVGLATLVAPLTSAVLGSVPDREAGMASAVNNAAARLAGLVGTAVLPLAAGLGGTAHAAGPEFSVGYARAMLISAALCGAGGAVAWLTIRRSAAVGTTAHPHHAHGCVRRRAAAHP